MLNVTLILADHPDPAQIQHIVMAHDGDPAVIILVFLAIVITPYWFFVKRPVFRPGFRCSMSFR